ncbi:MAG: porin [Flavobacteriaceae bacterium]
MKNLTASTILLVLMCFSVWNTSAQVEAPAFGKGLLNIKGKDSTYSMKVGLRIQFLAQTDTDLEDGQWVSPDASMKIRRARLKFDGFAYSPKLQYKIELGLSNDDMGGASIYTNDAARMILDAVVKYNFYKNWSIWAGQTKLPGNRERVVSSANLQFVNRSNLNSKFNIDREAGFQLRNHHKIGDEFVMREIFSFSQGEGRNVSTGNIGGFFYVGRLEFLPFGNFSSKGDYTESDLKREKTSKFSLGVTYAYNNDAVKTRSNQGTYMLTDTGYYQTDISTLFVDFMYKLRGFSAMGEFALMDAADPYAKDANGNLADYQVEVGNSTNIQFGYLFPKNYELAVRFTNITYEDGIDLKNSNEYTIGASKYIVGHKLKLQSDFGYTDTEGPNDGMRFRLQMELHF